MVKKTKHKENEKKTIEEQKQNSMESLMQQVMIGCKVPRVVKLLLIGKAQEQGILLSELVRKYIYEITEWNNTEIRKKIIEKLKT